MYFSFFLILHEGKNNLFRLDWVGGGRAILFVKGTRGRDYFVFIGQKDCCMSSVCLVFIYRNHSFRYYRFFGLLSRDRKKRRAKDFSLLLFGAHLLLLLLSGSPIFC